jgi:hypothetical protein
MTSVPVMARRGRFVTAETSGPGRVSFDRAFLFRDAQTTLVASADAHAYVAGLSSNGVPISGDYGPGHTIATLVFQHPETVWLSRRPSTTPGAHYAGPGGNERPDDRRTVSAASVPLTAPLELSHVGAWPMHYSVTSDVFWLSATPASGTVASGEVAHLMIRTDPRGRQPRPYHGTI